MTYVCRCCENTCACQDPKFGPAAIVSSNATGAYALTFCTSVPHPFQVGDKIRIANHQIGKAKVEPPPYPPLAHPAPPLTPT